VILVVRSMYKDLVLLLQEDRMLSHSELKKKVCLQVASGTMKSKGFQFFRISVRFC